VTAVVGWGVRTVACRVLPGGPGGRRCHAHRGIERRRWAGPVADRRSGCRLGGSRPFSVRLAGRPGVPLPEGWDAIPGARGCTPQSCGFRDHFADLKRLGVAKLYGLSTQTTDYQREAVERLHLPFAILSDADLKLTQALNLPTFTVEGMTLIKRMAWVIDEGVITKVFYPIFPPDRSAEDVVNWLHASR